MRHLFLALMIVLLPLRGWAGDVMAAQMSSTALAQTELAAHHMTHGTPADHATMALHADCAGHEAADGHAGAPENCGTCTACQLCHTVALTPPFPHPAPASLTAGQPQAPHPHFASAERAPGLKPPIS